MENQCIQAAMSNHHLIKSNMVSTKPGTGIIVWQYHKIPKQCANIPAAAGVPAISTPVHLYKLAQPDHITEFSNEYKITVIHIFPATLANFMARMKMRK